MSALEELSGALEDAFGKADAARNRIEKKQRGVESTGSLRERVPPGRFMVVFPVTERAADVTRIAHE